MTFDDESKKLYDAVAPTHDEAYFGDALKALDGLLPGDGALASRVEAFRQRFVIPPDKLDAVFRAAVDACRQQTVAHLTLPPASSSRSSTSRASRGAATTGIRATTAA